MSRDLTKTFTYLSIHLTVGFSVAYAFTGSITLAGLATDFCVAYSALDALAQGFAVTVRLDACRGIDLDGSVAAMLGRMREAGATLA